MYEWNPLNRHSALRVATVEKTDQVVLGGRSLGVSGPEERQKAGRCRRAFFEFYPPLLLSVVPHYCAKL